MKKTLMMALCIALCASLAIGGTMAYLSDTDSDVNVMTLGSVKIEQIEQERNENGELVPFTQAKPLFPAVYEGDKLYMVPAEEQPFSTAKDWEVTPASENVLDKIVTVKNIGKSDAYVRTIIAFETDNATDNTAWNKMHQIVNRNKETVAQSELEYAEFNDNGWLILMYTYKAALAPGETSMPSLKQIYMNKEMTNEDVEAVDGNGNGTYDVMVLSQAVQTAGFPNAETALNEAFGELNAENVAKWFGGVNVPSVSDASELAAALAAGGDVVLTQDIELTSADPIEITEDTTIYLNGNDLDASANESLLFNVTNGASLTINAEGAEIDCGKYGLVNMTEGELTINGGTFTNEAGNNGSFLKVNGDEEMTITLNNVTYKAGTMDSGVLRTSGANTTVIINGGEYEAGMGFIVPKGSVTGAKITATSTANMMPAIYGGDDVVIENCEIKSNCHAIAVGGGDTITVKNSNVVVPDGCLAFQVFSSGGTINVENCTWTGIYSTTGKVSSPAVINIDGVEKYRKNP